MKKKIVILTLTLCMLLSGCGGEQPAGSAVGQSSAQREHSTAEQLPAQPEHSPTEHPPAASPQTEQSPTEPPALPPQQEQPPTEQSQATPPGQAPSDTEEPAADYDFTVCFAGDINLAEGWSTTVFLDQQENGIYDCISEELTDIMNAADIMCLNNEFTYSTGGAPLAGKAYTFRALPERVEVLHQLGVDAVTLANNHVYDYGKEALLDTFAVLQEAGIPYFGAGHDLEEAMAPLYLEADGKTIALVGASRAEKNRMTPQATETEPGILRCYDTTLYKEAIAEAKANADFCIAFVHWGTEYSFDLEQVQLDTGKEYLDAGADVVIGAHSHCLQGMEFYEGKPIIYSLGNYWFNEKTLDTMLVQLRISGNADRSNIEVEIIPAVQTGCRTIYAQEQEEQRRIFDFLEEISVNVEITDEGIAREKTVSVPQ